MFSKFHVNISILNKHGREIVIVLKSLETIKNWLRYEYEETAKGRSRFRISFSSFSLKSKIRN